MINSHLHTRKPILIMFLNFIHYMWSYFWWTCGFICRKYKPTDNSPAEALEITVRPTEVHTATQTPIRPEMKAYIMYY